MNWLNFIKRYWLQIKYRNPPFLPDPFFGYVNTKAVNNCQVNYLMGFDGVITMRSRLSVNDKHLREEIIAKHFLSYKFGSEPYTVTGRDCPWDFQIQCMNSTFFLEITAVSDSQDRFMWLNDQDIIGGLLKNKTLVQKNLTRAKKHLNATFYSQIVSNIQSGDEKQYLVIKNEPVYENKTNEIILNAINQKAQKNHAYKNITALIIDNRLSSITPEDVARLIKEVRDKLRKYDFPEIWLYTGCCSDDSGDNGVCSFALLSASHV